MKIIHVAAVHDFYSHLQRKVQEKKIIEVEKKEKTAISSFVFIYVLW